MKKEKFKEFVKNNPPLITFVKNNEMTWQKFYEIYDLYGESNEIWDNYIEKNNNEQPKEIVEKNNKLALSGLALNQVVNWLKNVDLDGLQEGIGNVQRVIGVMQDFTKKEKTEQSAYKPRPLYKHFED